MSPLTPARAAERVASRQFEALGFDPAPGDPHAVAASAGAVRAVAVTVAAAGAAVARLDAGGWVGAAGDGFRTRLAPLPGDLDRAERAHRLVAAALTSYGAGLRRRQARAADLEALAAELRRRHSLAAGDAPVESLDAQIRQVLGDARRLHGEHAAAAAGTAAAIRAASDPPYERPGALARAVSAVRGWIADHTDVLVQVATVLKGVSAALGVLSLVPGMQFVAPLAMAAGGLALGIDLAVKVAAGRGSWRDLALGAVLTVVPWGPVARTVKCLPGVARVLRAANRAVPDPVKGRVFRAAGNLPDGIRRPQADAAAALIRRRAAHYGDDVVVQGSRAGYSTRPASDIDIGLRVSPARFEEIVASRYGEAAVGSDVHKWMSGAREKGIVHARRAGLTALRAELEPILGCKVDISVIKQGGRFDGEPWLPI